MLPRYYGREALQDNPKRPLLSAKYSGGIDTVGGNMLAAFLKSTKVGGCVAACGLVASDQLPITVYPFILRGVTLAGVTSASCPRPIREWVWQKLSTDWKVDYPESWIREVSLDELPSAIDQIYSGKVTGRVIVRVDTVTRSSHTNDY